MCVHFLVRLFTDIISKTIQYNMLKRTLSACTPHSYRLRPGFKYFLPKYLHPNTSIQPFILKYVHPITIPKYAYSICNTQMFTSTPLYPNIYTQLPIPIYFTQALTPKHQHPKMYTQVAATKRLHSSISAQVSIPNHVSPIYIYTPK